MLNKKSKTFNVEFTTAFAASPFINVVLEAKAEAEAERIRIPKLKAEPYRSYQTRTDSGTRTQSRTRTRTGAEPGCRRIREPSQRLINKNNIST